MRTVEKTGNSEASLLSTSSSLSPTYLNEIWFSDRNFVSIGDSAYILPYDDVEYGRQNTSHFLMKTAKRNRNTDAPMDQVLDNGGEILDIGCSSGVWCLDMASEYSDAHITGVDIFPVFPNDVRPKNTSFVEADAVKGMPFDDESFALVHVRFMGSSLRVNDWPKLLDECFRVCKKGGYIEVVESDIEAWKCGPLYTDFMAQCAKVLRARDLDPLIVRKLEMLLKRSGFQHVENIPVSLPLGPWGGKLGIVSRENVEAVFQTSTSLMAVALGITPEQYVLDLKQATAELDKHKGYHNYHTFIACKDP